MPHIQKYFQTSYLFYKTFLSQFDQVLNRLGSQLKNLSTLANRLRVTYNWLNWCVTPHNILRIW